MTRPIFGLHTMEIIDSPSWCPDDSTVVFMCLVIACYPIPEVYFMQLVGNETDMTACWVTVLTLRERLMSIVRRYRCIGTLYIHASG